MIKNVIICFGVIEDLDDPNQLGRVKVRIYNLHTQNKTLIPTETLKWSSIITTGGNSSVLGVGFTPTGLQIGDTILGFFLDGLSKQDFIVLGAYHAFTNDVNDVNVIARGEGEDNLTVKTKKALLTGTHKTTDYNTFQYPLVQVYQSRSGHVIIINDTPGNETVEVIHKTGSGWEFFPDGSLQTITQVQNNEINHGEKNVLTIKDENVDIKGSWNVNVSGTTNIKTTGNTNIESGGNTNIKSGGDTNIESGGVANVISDLIVTGKVVADGMVQSKTSLVAPGVEVKGGNISAGGNVTAGGNVIDGGSNTNHHSHPS